MQWNLLFIQRVRLSLFRFSFFGQVDWCRWDRWRKPEAKTGLRSKRKTIRCGGMGSETSWVLIVVSVREFHRQDRSRPKSFTRESDVDRNRFSISERRNNEKFTRVFTRWYQEIRIVVMSMPGVVYWSHRRDDDTNFLIQPRTRLLLPSDVHRWSCSLTQNFWSQRGFLDTSTPLLTLRGSFHFWCALHVDLAC